MASDWNHLVADKRRRQQESIPKEWLLTDAKGASDVLNYPNDCGLLSEQELGITNADVEVVLSNIANRAWSAVAVTTAFAKRAVIAHQLVNCLTEILIDRALSRAAELDDHLKRTGSVIGPLHGLPISLKDQICVKGYESVMGYVSWVGRYDSENALIVDLLEQAGAVIFVKTNVPQTLMWAETFNHVFGRTVNPFNRSLTCGGSSGGEGALIALKGSLLGVGSDIGGSVRIPAALQGLYGLRPSYGRIPYKGTRNSFDGQDTIRSVLGPLSTSLAGVKLFMKSVIDQRPWLIDPLSVRKPWAEDEYQLAEHGAGKQLCFAIIWDDGQVKPHPPIRRGLQAVIEALLKAGHRVIDWQPLQHKEINNVWFDIMYAASKEDFTETTASTKEPYLPSMNLAFDNPNVDIASLPAKLQSTLRPFVEKGVNAFALWNLQKSRRDLREAYLEHWNATVSQTGTGRPVDAIISPVAPWTAPPHGLNDNSNFTTVWNVLDYVALAMPTGLSVDPAVDVKEHRTDFLSARDKEAHERYDPDIFKGAPIGFQVVGRTLEEEAVIGIGEIVDRALRVDA